MRMVIAAALAVTFSTAALAETAAPAKAVASVEKVVSWTADQTAESKIVNKARCWVCGPD